MEETRRCRAHNRAGQQCGRAAIPGGLTCHYHGSAAPQVKAAAERRLIKAKALTELDKLGIGIEVPPEEALLGMVYEAAGNVAFYRQKIAEIGGEGALQALAGSPKHAVWTAILKTDVQGEQRIHVFVNLYNEERERLARFSKLAIDVGLSERMVKVAERQAEMLAGAIGAIIDDASLGLTAEQRQRARARGAQELRKLGAGG